MAPPKTRSKARPETLPSASEPLTAQHTNHRRRGKPSASEPQNQPERPGSAITRDQEITTVTQTAQVPLQHGDGHSAGRLSGTTARTSLNSIPGQDAAKHEELIDKLSELNDASSAVIDRLIPASLDDSTYKHLCRNFANGQGVTGRSIQKARRDFSAAWKIYGGTDTLSVDDAVRRVLQLEDDTTLPASKWRPDDVFYKANLAKTLQDIYALEEAYDLDSDSAPSGAYLLRLSDSFPAQFMRHFDPQARIKGCGLSSLITDTLGVALALRIQLLCHEIGSRRDLSSGEVVAISNDFFGSEGNLKGWAVEGLRATDLTSRQTEAILKTKDTVLASFSSSFEGAVLESEKLVDALQSAYPVTEFRKKLIRWIHRRSKEVDGHLETIGKVPGIQEAIEHFTLKYQGQGKHHAESPISYYTKNPQSNLASSFLNEASAADQSTTLTAAEKFKMWARRKKAVRSSAPQLGRIEDGEVVDPGIVTPDHQHGMNANDRARFIAMYRGREAEADKENKAPRSLGRRRARAHFIDEQPYRERISFEDTLRIEKTQAALQSYPKHTSSSFPTQDEGFEEDRRSTIHSRKRPARHDARAEASPKRRRVDSTNETETTTPQRSTSAESKSTHERSIALLNAGDSAQPQAETSEYPEAFEPLRRAWTDEETDELKTLIATYGCRWSLIETLDHTGTLKLRGQVAMKDKARNLKNKFLRDNPGGPLPKYWEYISMKEADKRKLMALGVPKALCETVKSS